MIVVTSPITGSKGIEMKTKLIPSSRWSTTPPDGDKDPQLYLRYNERDLKIKWSEERNLFIGYIDGEERATAPATASGRSQIAFELQRLVSIG